MIHNRFKKLALVALSLLLAQVAVGQSDVKEHKHNTIRIDTRNISKEISNVFRTVAFEINKIDFERVGDAVASVADQIGSEVGDIEVIVEGQDEPDPEPRELVGTAEKSRIISKTYSVNKSDKLAINNQYGKVEVHVWNKNEIKVDVEVKAFEATDNGAQELLDKVKITDLRQNDLISFKTTIEKSTMNIWTRIRNGKEERRGVQINYVIYMPAKNALDIHNRHGSTTVPDFSGPVNISSSYGSFKSGRLDNPANQVKISYGSATMEEYANGNLNVSYSGLKLSRAEKINATIKYSNAKIATLSNGGNFELAYASGFKIDDVDKNVKSLNINSSYSGVTLGIDENADFNFDVTVSYAGFNYNNQKMNLVNQMTDASKTKSWNPTKNYKGSMGKGSDSKITIKSNYGGVKFL
ncbi:hypothetical protein [Daejeonella sp. JGW-45]|uniref:hypothetical protein n=1 Tax=Daejeonella sp. JGW-45 TaxID=3034148 RepID=UPI0023EC7694|nr:hypothetical protein [Daejeonella sp. JGW-45]